MKEIETVELSKYKPEPILRDSRGRTFKEGYKVAYNRSGRVCEGVIKHFLRTEWVVARQDRVGFIWWTLKFTVIVEGIDGTISAVRNPNSLMII